jgi:hypothetical protein
MEYFWLSMGIAIFLLVTTMCFKENFTSWSVYYLFSLASFLFFFFRRFMRKRMEKHQAYLDEQHKLGKRK